MAPTMSAASGNYARFANCPALYNLQADRGLLFEKLVDLIIESLESDYDYKPDDFPIFQGNWSSFAKKWTASQRKMRDDMVQLWLEDIEQSEDIQWHDPPKIKTNVLNSLFDSVWEQRTRGALPSSDREILMGPSTASDSDFQRGHNIGSCAARYGKYAAKNFGNDTLRGHWVSRMSKYLRDPIWKFNGKERITRQNLIDIGGNLDYKKSAIYLHILWHPDDDDDTYYLYVGQSSELDKRIKNHEDPLYRTRHRSLHYFVWDSRPGMLSKFVVLAYLDDMETTTQKDNVVLTPESQLTLNIAEFWAALMFQTLPRLELERYMDVKTVLGRQHLNVANPLWQNAVQLENAFSNMSRQEIFHSLIKGADEATCKHYRSLREAFFKLQGSSDPVARAYYEARRERSHKNITDNSAKASAQVLEDLLKGRDKKISLNSDKEIPCICFGSFIFRLGRRKYPEVLSCGTVFAQVFLQEERASECYAIDSTDSDPARRLSLRITGKLHDRQFAYFVRAGGDVTAQTINVLVDLLDGVEKAEILRRARRSPPNGLWDDKTNKRKREAETLEP